MNIEWTQAEIRSEYYYGNTNSRFSIQIGQSTNAEKYVWMIFHDDLYFCICGDEADTLDEAKEQSLHWLNTNAKPHATNS